MPKKHLLFAYGILKNDGKIIRRHKINGSMYDLGPFPAITRLDTDRMAIGNIIEIDTETLARFDRIEGVCPEEPLHGLYRRESIDTDLGPVWIYLYNGRITSPRPISEWFDNKMRFANESPQN